VRQRSIHQKAPFIGSTLYPASRFTFSAHPLNQTEAREGGGKVVTPGFRPPGFEALTPVRALRIGSQLYARLQLLSDQSGQDLQQLFLGEIVPGHSVRSCSTFMIALPM
jgi:hypothetical protein